jgi:hypothetical protein
LIESTIRLEVAAAVSVWIIVAVVVEEVVGVSGGISVWVDVVV